MTHFNFWGISVKTNFMQRSLPLFLALLGAAALLPGQTVSGVIAGSIFDPTGASVPNAKIVVTNTATGVQATATAGGAGEYRIGNLPVGSYDLSVSASGFTTTEVKGLAVQLSQTLTKNVTVSVSQSSTTVEVSASVATIDTTTAQIENTFSSKQVADLPTASTGSGVINLSLLTPGVASSGAVGAGTGPSVGGQRPRNNNFMIEGVDNNNKSVTGPLVSVPNDSIAEFTLLENQFSAEFGHSSGGQFNEVVKSGTNQFHGTIYDYEKNKILNASDNLNVVSGNPPNPRYDNTRLGANFGGPIKKNKIFFFVSFEYNPIGQAGSPGQVFAPTQAGYSTLASIPGFSATNLKILQQYLPAQSAAVPAASTPNGAYPVVCAPGGLNTQQNYLANGCAGTQYSIPLGQYSYTSPSYQNNFAGVSSVDYNISDKDNLRGRFIYNRSDQIDNAASLPSFFTTTPYRNYLVTLSEFHNFTPNVVNEFRLGYNRYYNVLGVGPQTFPGLDSFPNLDLDELNTSIGPDGNAPQETIQNLYQGTDNISLIKGPHSFKFGVNFQKLISPQTFTQRQRGEYEYSTIESYLADWTPDGIGERTNGHTVYYGDQIQFGAFVNDDWKIRPNFTVNLGVRYNRSTLPYSERLQSVNSISSVPGLINFNEPKPQNFNFQPRIGFAYSPGTAGTTSIRGGFGINYDELFDNLGILSLAPQFQQTVDVGVNYPQFANNFLGSGGLAANLSSGTLTAAAARAATGGYITDQKEPKSLQWNLGIQHVFARDYTIEVRYLGTRGIDLPVQDRLNITSPVTAATTLPLYITMPSQSVINSLTQTLANLQAPVNGVPAKFVPAYYNAGFRGNITAYEPIGNSTYHGLATSLQRRLSNGLTIDGSYTWSHNIDDSTAEVFSTLTTPRRPQDFQNLRADRSDSALDHRQRMTVAIVYDLPFFKNSNWLLKNIVGNWEFAPIYTYQTGTWLTLQSEIDSNLNGDSYGDRTYVNPTGSASVGSGTTAIKNAAGATVGYVANNPNARYIQAPAGVYPNASRNTANLPPIDDVDLNILKRLSYGERLHMEFGAQLFNGLNHPQYIGGYLNDVAPIGFTGTDVRNFLQPSSSSFLTPQKVFSSNPRTIQVSAKFIF